MKRFEFLKRLGFGVAAAAVTPSVFLNKENTNCVGYVNPSTNIYGSEWAKGYYSVWSDKSHVGDYGELFKITKK